MGLREQLNRRPLLIGTVIGIAALSCTCLVAWQLFARTDPRLGTGNAYYSVDDGKSFFVADSANLPPFDYQGKQAVQAFVYSSDGGKTRFVGYLQRFTPAGLARMTEKRKKLEDTHGMPTLDTELLANTEVKKPGEKNWVKLSDRSAASRVMTVTDPGNATRVADLVDP